MKLVLRKMTGNDAKLILQKLLDDICDIDKQDRTQLEQKILRQIADDTRLKGDEYETRVQELENQGCTRSDAQGIVDAEILKEIT